MKSKENNKILVDSNSLNSRLYWCCYECGKSALRKEYNTNKRKALDSHYATYHLGQCNICLKEKDVTELRDFNFPIFELDKTHPEVANHLKR